MFDSRDLDWLLKLRVAVARCGEIGCSSWWNTNGQLSRLGDGVIARGFPRTHHFAQARSVFAAAANRCSEVFGLPDAATLWWLGEDAEEAFDLQWEHWLDQADTWAPFFNQVADGPADTPLSQRLLDLGLVEQSDIDAIDAIAIDPSGHSVRTSPTFDGSRGSIGLLALGFGKGSVGRPVVPYTTFAS